MDNRTDEVGGYTCRSFFDSFRNVYERHNIEHYTSTEAFNSYIQGYSLPKSIENNSFIDKDTLREKLKNIWHSVSMLQMELANYLIFSSRIIHSSKTTDDNELNKALSAHHLSLSYECLYRVWETVTQVLFYLHYYDSKKTIYFNEMADRLHKSGLYDEKIIKKLKRQVGNWDKTAQIRNKYSHESSKLFEFNYVPSTILNEYGMPYYLEERSIDFRQEGQSLIERYKNIKKLNQVCREFVDNYPVKLILPFK